MKNPSTDRELKEWNPTPDQLEIIREKYSVYNDPPRRYTKTRLIEMFKITDILFMRLIARNRIRPKKMPSGYVKDFSAYKRVPVPSSYKGTTYILIHPDRDAEEAKQRYIERQELNREMKQNEK